MLARFLGIDEGAEVSLRGSWSPAALGVLILIAATVALVLYWRQRSLKRRRRLLLGVLRASLYALLLVVLFEPVVIIGRTIRLPTNVLVLVDVSESMNVEDLRKDEDERREAALALGVTRYRLLAVQEGLARTVDSLVALEAALVESSATEQDSRSREASLENARLSLGEALESCVSEIGEGSDSSGGPQEDSRAHAARLQNRMSELLGRLDRPTLDTLATDIRDIRTELQKLQNELSMPLPVVPDSANGAVEAPARVQLVREILAHPDLPMLRGQAGEARVRYFRFGERLEPTAGEGEALWQSLRDVRASATVTRLGQALSEAVDRYSGQTIDGVILLTDGGSNDGIDPLEVARSLGELSIPVYPVGIGLPSPEDVRVKSVVVQDTVFEKDRVPVKVEVGSHGYGGTYADVVLSLDGEEVARQAIVLTDESQFVALEFVPQGTSGAVELRASVTPQAGEISTENNEARRSLQVIREKIKVLYVEGRPRWEYRYLRAILLRDERLTVRFLLTEGDPDLAGASPLHIAKFPEDPSDADRYDLVILGDVPASYFTLEQLNWVSDLVRAHGGSLFVIAGSGYGPGTFEGTPIADVLPVDFSEGWIDVDPSVYPLPTPAGSRSVLVQLDPLAERNLSIWSLARPLHRVPRIDGVKPGATVLATLSDRSEGAEAYPLVAWQRYGTGKSMVVATDQLWRLRFRRGDTYHARFWGQAIRFLTLSRLLGENKRIRLETDRREYLEGERIEVYANVLSDTYEPLTLPSYSVELQAPDELTVRDVPLEAVPGTPGLFRASLRAEGQGTHTIRVPSIDQPYSRPVEIVVRPSSREQLEPEMQDGILRKIAELSGGEFLRIRDLPKLPAFFRTRPREIRVEEEREIWDHWGLFAFLLAGAGLEWFLRRRNDLA